MTGLLVAFLLTFSCFIASSIYTTIRMHELTEHADAIAANALPSVIHLSNARNELHHLERALQDAVDGRTAWTRESEQAAFTQFDNEVAVYLTTEVFPGEVELWQEASEQITILKDAVGRTSALLQEHDPAAMTVFRKDVLPAMNAAFEALGKVVVINSTYGTRAATDVRRSEERLTELAIGLDVFSLLFSSVVGFFGLRAALRYTRFVQRRATELEEFAARVAHDVRGPLAPALVALQYALKTGDAQTKRMAERGERSLKRVVSLVDDLLTFAMGAAEPDTNSRTSLHEAMAGILSEIEPLALERHTEVHVEPFEDVSVACTSGVLASILSNLVRNSIKYMGTRDVQRVTLRAFQTNDTVRIEVQDTGPGIPAEYRAGIFEPYIRGPRTAEAGLGLGLATVKHLVEAYGGTVTFRTVDGVGTTFSVEMPTADGSKPA